MGFLVNGFSCFVSTSEVTTLYNISVSGVQSSELLMSLDCNSMRLVSPAFRVTFFLKVCKSFPSGANSSFLTSKVDGSGFTLGHDWYNHHRTCECGEKLPFKQTIIQCTKSQNVLGRPLLIVSVPVPHHVSLLLKCFLLESSSMTK